MPDVRDCAREANKDRELRRALEEGAMRLSIPDAATSWSKLRQHLYAKRNQSNPGR